MSFEATRWAWTADVEPCAKLVLLALADHADASGLCWPSLDRLMVLTGRQRRTVTRALDDLDTAGLIHRERSTGRRVTKYRLALDVVEQGRHVPIDDDRTGTSGPCSMEPNRDVSARQQGRQRAPTGTSCPPNHQEPSVNHQQENTRADTNEEDIPMHDHQLAITPTASQHLELDLQPADMGQSQHPVVPTMDTFDEFWHRYPRKVGRRTAHTAYNRALHRTTHTEIVTALDAHLAPWSRMEQRFVPHASTWLNRDGWLDDPPTVPGPTNKTEARSRLVAHVAALGRTEPSAADAVAAVFARPALPTRTQS
jgi:hypothetical protein